MNNKTKELLPDMQDLAIHGSSVVSLLNGLIDIASQLEAPTDPRQQKLFDSVQNGLPGIALLLESAVVSKLFDLDEYVSIKGEIYQSVTDTK